MHPSDHLNRQKNGSTLVCQTLTQKARMAWFLQLGASRPVVGVTFHLFALIVPLVSWGPPLIWACMIGFVHLCSAEFTPISLAKKDLAITKHARFGHSFTLQPPKPCSVCCLQKAIKLCLLCFNYHFDDTARNQV